MIRSCAIILSSAIIISSYSCGIHSKSPYTNPLPEQLMPDCSGITTELKIPAGLSGANAKTLAGQTFAILEAVDKLDGGMQIRIKAPTGGFPLGLIDDYKDFNLRFIACRENTSSSSLLGGLIAYTACSNLGSINVVGKEGIIVDDFSSGFYTASGNTIHNTTNPTFDKTNKFLHPDFIMLTAGDLDNNPVGKFMIAFGRSPYYNNCYSKNY